MINDIKIIEDGDDSIHAFTMDRIRYRSSIKLSEFEGMIELFGGINITKILMWNEKWSYEKEIECEKRCQCLFNS